MTAADKPLRVDVWHNILWSRYKGEVFSSLYKLADKNEFDLRFFQIAETEGNRAALSGVALERHRYPFDLLFKGSLDNIGLLKRLAAMLPRTLRSDAELVVLAGYEKPEYWAQMVAARLRGKKIAVFCDSTLNDQKQKFLRSIAKRIIFKNMNGVFGYGTRSRDYVVHYGADPAFAFKECQAAALPEGYTPEKALAARIASAPSQDAPRFLFVGRLSPEKDPPLLLKAFAKVKAWNDRATLILVGEGPLRAELEQQAKTIGNVTLTGGKNGSDLFDEYAKATCLILCSASETWGLVVNEALSHGCPAIVSARCGCVPELIEEGVTGFVHDVGDADDLARKMLAAPASFANVNEVAQDCIAVMSRYTPDKAAQRIIAGMRAILQPEEDSQ